MKRFVVFVSIVLFSIGSFSQNWSGGRNRSSLHYNGILESGYTFGIGEWGQSAFKADLVNGVRIDFYSVGIGLGLRAFNLNYHEKKGGNTDSTVMDPAAQASLYLDNRIELPGTRISPYLGFGIGVSFLPGEFSLLSGPSVETSLFISASAGITWKISEKVRLIGGVVFESYDIKYYEELLMNGYSYTVKSHHYFLERSKSLGFTIGVSVTP